MADPTRPRRKAESTDAVAAADPVQRRSSFRVRPLPTTTAPAEAHFRHPMFPEMLLKLRILDLSVTGCALLAADDIPAIAPGIRIHGVQLVLGATSRIATGLELQHITSIDHDSDARRLGCCYTQMEPGGERALQRHIDQVQRMERLRRPGRPG